MAATPSYWLAAGVMTWLFAIASVHPALGQHFSDCLSTTSNATILIPEGVSSSLGADGKPLASGDEIAVFTDDGDCAGAGQWNGSSLALAAAGINSQEATGYAPGESFKFKIWDASAQVTYHPEVTYASCSAVNPLCRDDGRYQSDMVYTVSHMVAASEDSSEPPPPTLELLGNAPNPFQQRTTIHFKTPEATRVTLTVYNVLGQKIATLVDRELPAGSHEVTWSGHAQQGQALGSGVYLYRIRAGDRSRTGRMTVVR